MHKRGPWITLNSKIVYENAWITVREDQVIRPDGGSGIYGVVESQVATGVLALTPEEEVYLVGQYRYAMEEYSWEIIEGGAHPGETPLAACQRELREEAGLVAAQWAPLGHESHLSNSHTSERAFLYVARELTEVAAAPDCTEALQLQKVPIQEALVMVDRGEIKDAMSIMGLLLYTRHHPGIGEVFGR